MAGGVITRVKWAKYPHQALAVSPTAETPTKAPQSKKLNRGCDIHDSTDSHDNACLKKILQTSENPDEAVRNYL